MEKKCLYLLQKMTISLITLKQLRKPVAWEVNLEYKDLKRKESIFFNVVLMTPVNKLEGTYSVSSYLKDGDNVSAPGALL